MVPRTVRIALPFILAGALATVAVAQISTEVMIGTWQLIGAGESESEARARAEGVDIRFEFGGDGRVAVFRDGELLGEDGYRVEPGILVVIGAQTEQRWEVVAGGGGELLIRLPLEDAHFYQYWHKER